MLATPFLPSIFYLPLKPVPSPSTPVQYCQMAYYSAAELETGRGKRPEP